MTWIALALAGGIGAFVVGMIGFGTSLVVLPTLAILLPTMFAPDVALRLATGTTMATMAVGAVVAGVARSRSGHVCWPLLRLAVLPYAAGALLGPWLGRYLPVDGLRLYVAGILMVVGVWTLRRQSTGSGGQREWRAHKLELRAALFGIGLASSVAGIASGIFAIPYLSRFAIPFRTVIGTSTVAAALYSTFGTLGHVSAGWTMANPPAWSLGYVYLPALAVMAVAGAVCAPLGVRLAGRMNDRLLRNLLALVILGAALVIAWPLVRDVAFRISKGESFGRVVEKLTTVNTERCHRKFTS
ncbi:MAG: sulfite exporter TauE/SafE family protein [Gammaproteobacteria bacterium]|nr:MAG: sulfite exporter TauE/SafE family protein [Gammaproteobacteria bacterium]